MTRTVATRRIEAGSYMVIVDGIEIGNIFNMKTITGIGDGWQFSTNGHNGYSCFHGDTKRDVLAAFRRD